MKFQAPTPDSLTSRARLKECSVRQARTELLIHLCITWWRKEHSRLVKNTASSAQRVISMRRGLRVGAGWRKGQPPTSGSALCPKKWTTEGIISFPQSFRASFPLRSANPPDCHQDTCAPNWKRRIGKPGCKLVIIGPALVSTLVPIHVAHWGIPKLVRLKTLKLSKRS
jgi:hypothetical protein